MLASYKKNSLKIILNKFSNVNPLKTLRWNTFSDRSEKLNKISIKRSLNISGISDYLLQLYELPSGEYIRIIRFGIKQLHAFVDSGKKDISPTGELKKMVLPMIQGKMYIFLRHLIHRWPLDGSFRLLLELWLSFIQPWRYPCSYFQKIER